MKKCIKIKKRLRAPPPKEYQMVISESSTTSKENSEFSITQTSDLFLEEEDNQMKEEILKFADQFVKNVLCTAHVRLRSDPQRLFFYRKPCAYVKPTTVSEEGIVSTQHSSAAQTKSAIDFTKPKLKVQWICIREFDIISAMTQISEFIDTWELSPHTKYIMENIQKNPTKLSNKGTMYNVMTVFHKPTEDCPNPLARAKVVFKVTVPMLMPDFYEIMVSYRFEGYNTLYYALGDRCLNSTRFQRFYIDTILDMKLAFYSEVFKCTHPEDCPNCQPLFRQVCKDLNQGS